MRARVRWEVSLGDLEPQPLPFINSSENWLGLLETYQLNSCASIREELEKIFKTTSDGINKHGLLYPTGSSTCYWQAIADDNIYLKSIHNDLRTMVKKYFTDIKGDEEHLDKVTLALYYNVIDEKLDEKRGKLIFDGDAFVTRSEFPEMLYKALWPSGTIYEDYNKTKINSDPTMKQYRQSWVTPYICVLNDSLFVGVGNGLTEYNVNEPITKLECITLIVNYLYKGEKPRKEASEHFNDVKLKECADNLGDIELLKEFLENPTDGVDKASYRALSIAGDINILRGDDNHNSNWYEPINRFETVGMLYNLAIYENMFRIKI